MWKLSVFAIALVLFIPMAGYAQTSENQDAQAETAINLSAEGFPMTYSEEGIQALRYKTIMARWREKQYRLWENLKTDSFTINASAYTASADECGNSKGITASGIKVEKNRTLACPPEYPFGTKIEIETMGTFICEDRGGAIKQNHFDIYVEKKAEAFAFGRKNLTARVVLE